jgi:hypothetical protein
MSQSLPTGQLSNVPWRKSEVWYAANDIYVDLIEEVGAVHRGIWGGLVIMTFVDALHDSRLERYNRCRLIEASANAL